MVIDYGGGGGGLQNRKIVGQKSFATTPAPQDIEGASGVLLLQKVCVCGGGGGGGAQHISHKHKSHII